MNAAFFRAVCQTTTCAVGVPGCVCQYMCVCALVCIVYVRQLLNMSAITTRMDSAVTWPHTGHTDAGTATTSTGHNPLASPTGRRRRHHQRCRRQSRRRQWRWRWQLRRRRQTRNGILWRVIGIYISSSCCRETCAYAYTHTYSNYTHTHTLIH